MSVIDAPYQLSANKFLPKISNLIVVSRVKELQKIPSWMDKFSAFFMQGTIPSGDGFQYDFLQDVGTEIAIDETKPETVLNIYKAKGKSVAITTDYDTAFPITVPQVYIDNAFEDLRKVEELNGQMWAIPEKTRRLAQLDNIHMPMFFGSTCTKEYFDLSITGTTSVDKLAEREMVLEDLVQYIQKVADTASILTDVYTNGETKYLGDPNELVFIYNKKYLNRLKATILAPLFKGEVILEMANVKSAIQIPEAYIEDKKYPTNFICAIVQAGRFNHFYKFLLNGTFENGYLKYGTVFRKECGGKGEVDDFFCVQIFDGVKPPAPTAEKLRIREEAWRYMSTVNCYSSDTVRKELKEVLQEIVDGTLLDDKLRKNKKTMDDFKKLKAKYEKMKFKQEVKKANLD